MLIRLTAAAIMLTLKKPLPELFLLWSAGLGVPPVSIILPSHFSDANPGCLGFVLWSEKSVFHLDQPKYLHIPTKLANYMWDFQERDKEYLSFPSKGRYSLIC